MKKIEKNKINRQTKRQNGIAKMFDNEVDLLKMSTSAYFVPFII